MSKWNPSNPQIAGDEYLGAAVKIVQATKALGVGMAFTAAATETIDTVETLLRGVNPPSSLVCDIYDLANPLVDVQEVVTCIPASNFSNAGGWTKDTGGVFTAYDAAAHNNVDEPVGEAQPINTGATNSLVYVGIRPTQPAQIMFYGGNANFYDGTTGGAGSTIAGKRVAFVTVFAIADNFDSAAATRVDGCLNLGGNRYFSDSGPITMKAGAGLTRLRFAFYYNPTTGRPWTNADIVNLTNGTDGHGIAVLAKSNLGNFVVTTVDVRFHLLPERRLATGYGNSTTADQWSGYALVDPADGATPIGWAKAAGSRYLVCLSSCKSGSPGQFAAIMTTPVAGHEGDLAPGSNLMGINLGLGNVPSTNQVESPGQFCAMLLSSGSPSDDTNPYGDVIEVTLGAAGATPYVTNTATQQVSTEGAFDYGMAFLVIGATGNGAGGVLQDQPISVTLNNGGGIVAGPVDINPGDVPPDGKYHLVKVAFSPGYSAGAGEALFLELDSSSSVGWRLPLLMSRTRFMSSADSISIAAAAAGIGSTADSAFADVTQDFPWAIVTAPDPPGAMAATPTCMANQPLLAYTPGPLPGISPKMPTEVCYAALTWGNTALGGEFLYYELQRFDNLAPFESWDTIARIVNEGAAFFNDFESLREIAISYRVRVVRTDGAFSDWVQLGADVTVPIEHNCDVVLASNVSPQLAFATQDLGGVMAWQPRQAQQPVYVDIYGRDDPMAFFGGEDGGESFSRELAVAYNDPAVGSSLAPGRSMFDVMIALLHNRQLPYVAYVDGYFRKWYVSAAVQQPRHTEPGSQYVATVVFTQVASVPAPVVTDSPWELLS